ncbi:hypothetical protein EZV62_010449 [Acer yangbiense]|uniref:Uncharacterized protein n=1 Tax=Acer yangbiense TaxID=1000413 RepID=A0A5C7I2W9_9ROSI|nr:hypothetical protein EZV62_010449 [Acer yangbiense]
MATENLKQRIRDDTKTETETETETKNSDDYNNKNGSKRDNKRMSMAKRGLRSLITAVAFPVSLTLFNIYVFGSNHSYNKLNKPFWLPPLWLLHTTCLVSSFLMGVSAWLVWAEGGFHKKPTALSLYLAVLGLGLVWEPITIRMGANWVGLVLCLGMFGSLVGCSRVFKEVNPIAGDLVKPCLAGAAFLSIVNLELLFL